MKHRGVILNLCVALATLSARALTLTEDFSGNPQTNGWHFWGDTNLFAWDSTNQYLRVTWDSTKPNSFFHRPLGTILTRSDDFSLSFDLTFEDYAAGVTPGKPGAYEAALGFLNFDQAAQSAFSRGAGVNSTNGPRNLVEFDFFPSFDVFLPTIAQTVVGTNFNNWLYNHDNLLEMTPGEAFHVAMNFSAASRTLTTVVTNNGTRYGDAQTIVVPTNMDFRVATFSVSSYSEQGQDVFPPGSILAHGIVDNISIVLPPPPVENLTGTMSNGVWCVRFNSRSNWLYTLERTTNLSTWADVSTTTAGNGASLELQDSSPPVAGASYRLRASRP